MILPELFSHRLYRSYALGSLGSLTGVWAQRMALGWLTWELTGSVTWLGLLALADAAPLALLSVPGGAASDRGGALSIVRRTLAASAGCALALWLLSTSGTASMAAVLALTFLNSVASAFGQPARMVLAPSLVPRSLLPAAVAFGSVSLNLARCLGPAAGGLLIVHGGLAAVFAFNALTYGAFALCLRPLGAAAGRRPARGPLSNRRRAGSR